VAALPKDKQKAYAGILADKDLAETLGNGVLMQSDYTRNQMALSEEKKTIADAHAKNVQTAAELKKWREENVTKVEGIMRDSESLKVENVKTKERIRTLSTKYGIPEDDVKDILQAEQTDPTVGTGTQVQNAQSQAKVGSGQGQPQGNYVDRDTFNSSLDSNAQLAAQLHDIQADHRELFPDQPRIRTAELLAEASKYATEHPDEKVTLQSYWEQKYKVPERRETLKTEAFEKRVQDEVDAREKARITEDAMNGVSMGTRRSNVPDSQGSPLLALARKGAFKEGLGTDDTVAHQNRGINNAVAIMERGDFRQPDPLTKQDSAA
jgi:hypothetical protein